MSFLSALLMLMLLLASCSGDSPRLQSELEQQSHRINEMEQRLAVISAELEGWRAFETTFQAARNEAISRHQSDSVESAVTPSLSIDQLQSDIEAMTRTRSARPRPDPEPRPVGPIAPTADPVPTLTAEWAWALGTMVGNWEAGAPITAERPQTPDDHYSTSGAQGQAGMR